MIYKTNHWLCKNELVYIIEEEEDLYKVHYLSTGREEWIHQGWLEEYILNKGKGDNANE